MEISTELGIMLAYAAGILLLYVVGYIFMFPIKVMMKLIINSVIGALCLLALNFAAGPIGLHIPVNLITAAVTGILGVPGVVLLALYQYVM